MSSGKELSRFGGVVVTAFLGVFFFFLIIGVFGLRFAIAGLLAFVIGALAVCRTSPAGGTQP